MSAMVPGARRTSLSAQQTLALFFIVRERRLGAVRGRRVQVFWGIGGNIAAIQLRDAALPQKLLRVLAECGVPPQRLEIEVTEDALVSDFECARGILTSLKNLGVAMALDDFGAGYSSLRHLRELPFTELKVDRSFVNSIADSDEALSIVRTIIQLAQSLGLGVTAEGVETEAQARALRALGCETGQGFLLGGPSAGPSQALARVEPEAQEKRVSTR